MLSSYVKDSCSRRKLVLLQQPTKLSADKNKYHLPGPQREIFQGVRRSIPGPKILLGPPSLIAAHSLNRFLADHSH